MSYFNQPLPHLKYVQADDFYVYLQSDLVFYSSKFGRLEIPAGFRSDGASVPQFFWNVFPPFGRYLYAAIVHDYYCAMSKINKSPLSSVEAATLFLEALKCSKVLLPKRIAMYSAVRLFGPKF